MYRTAAAYTVYDNLTYGCCTLQGLPLRIETLGQIKRKADLDQRLREIEDAFKIFSRPKVVVHI